ncbi:MULTISPECIES: IS4-like element ISSav1 family transposase [Streptomyces]|uniref:IS4 family ISFsp6-like transposase n=2 Tax=Streptomyces avermitilis TaxID=33903 RepID=Q82R31_STRAW|nr:MULTISPECIES: IS4-like element ISSav1 family transposase [Streptomyces]MYS96016.1 IS4-like element ISSav1 family transposase [Streptomyces sp. SID5469]BAC68022.1 putative IS4 family ISFsp6-like transposase [Streptomyces avermitilis MA-4680 = NBRC 14893]BBJ47763.1 transposase [Streptomyces avermitilis]GDY69861.1 transposase [Streptomyces avermitilis]GDY80130.1 transposase [Streptomyces avermitilis]
MPVQCSTVTLTSSITVADGIFAPGHLGELTQQLPFELVDDVLERAGGAQHRLRLLPSRVGVYFVLALALFPQLGYVRVWDKLTAGLRGILHRRPSEKALREVRRRLGVAPLRLLFETLAGPVAQPITPGVRYRCWRTVAFDGCSSTKAPDRPRVCAWLGKHKHRYGTDGYPMLKIMVLCETGTRALLGAVFGPTPEKETGYAEQLLPLLDGGMLLLNDRGFDSDDFLAKAAATGAQLLVRLKGTRTPARWALLPDGSFLTRINGTRLRVIDAHIAVTTAKGLRLEGHYRLATTLTDHRRYPAVELVELYHERWEIESAFYSLRHTLQCGLVLRSQDVAGIQQELWAHLTVYQALRRAMVEAVETLPGTDPDRASFTVALETAKEQLITAANVLPDAGPGRITSALLHDLLPPRQARVNPRRVKCPISRYAAPPDQAQAFGASRITSIAVTVHSSAGTGSDGRRDHTLQLLRTNPLRTWRACEIARGIGLDDARGLRAELGRWVREGILRRTGRGIYTLEPEWITPDLHHPSVPPHLTTADRP